MCRLIRVGDFGLTKDNQKGSRKRKRFREEEKAARKGYAFLKKHSEKSGFRRKDEVTGDAFCRKFVKRKGVGQNAIPSQNETKLILLLSVVIVLLLTIPVSSSKKKEVNRLGFTSFLCRLIRVGDFGLTKDNQKGSRKRNNGRDVFGACLFCLLQPR